MTLKPQLKAHAPGLTPRSVPEQLHALQMLDVRAPTTDGRWLLMSGTPNQAQLSNSSSPNWA